MMSVATWGLTENVSGKEVLLLVQFFHILSFVVLEIPGWVKGLCVVYTMFGKFNIQSNAIFE